MINDQHIENMFTSVSFKINQTINILYITSMISVSNAKLVIFLVNADLTQLLKSVHI